jgi:hypothetical protein
MADLLKIIAALEWIALGLFCLHWVRKWNKQFSDLYDELKDGDNDG